MLNKVDRAVALKRVIETCAPARIRREIECLTALRFVLFPFFVVLGRLPPSYIRSAVQLLCLIIRDLVACYLLAFLLFDAMQR